MVDRLQGTCLVRGLGGSERTLAALPGNILKFGHVSKMRKGPEIVPPSGAILETVITFQFGHVSGHLLVS